MQTRLFSFLPLMLLLTCGCGALVAQDVSKLVPLTELGEGKYKGEIGGLYGNGMNEPPEAHLASAIGSGWENLDKSAAERQAAIAATVRQCRVWAASGGPAAPGVDRAGSAPATPQPHGA